MVEEQKRARLAFVGCGSFATSRIFPQIPLIPEIDLVAVCDLVREKAERNARNFGARRVYTEMERLLDQEELDGVFCIGPAPQQYALAPAVLRRGLPVYVEKPSAVTSAQARELAQLAEQHGTWGQVGFMKRFADVYAIAKEVIGRPEFGPLHVVKCKFGQGAYPQIWGIDSARRAMLIGQMVHIFDLVRYFGGEIAQVHAMFRPVTDNNFAWAVNLRFATGGGPSSGGAIGQLDINTLDTKSPFRDIIEELELIGLHTHVKCEDMLRVTYQPQESWSPAAPHAGRFEHTFNPSWTGVGNALSMFGYTGEVRHFARKCIGRAEGGPTLWDSYRALQLGEAIYESGESGRLVDVPAGAHPVDGQPGRRWRTTV